MRTSLAAMPNLSITSVHHGKAESASACGVKARELVLKKTAGRPCGAASGQLYSDDPSPQTIYHVKVSPGQPAVAFIRLNVH